MQTVNPNIPLKLWVVYTEDYIPVTGLTDLTVYVVDINDNVILSTTVLTEDISNDGYYYYDLDISSLTQETVFFVYYKKGTTIINIEEFFVDIDSDNIGRAF